MNTLRTGIDLIEINRLERLDPAIRKRFLHRVFTADELEESHGLLPSLAGRFAAKEAVAKALGCGIGPISWQEIEVRRGEQGQPMLKLSGNASLVAEEQGLITWSISISHTREYAVAIAVATTDHSEK
ncbi:MAG: holo-ACP synthase [Anaerolineaceae bacterium]|nr:holo-ACP synthase [Anaerolineaceae bacterium]